VTARPDVRTRLRRGLGAVAVAVVAALPVVLVAGASEAVAYPQMTSTGSSFAAPAITEWTGQVATLYGLPINFQGSSSVIGLDNFAQNTIDFGASDIAYSTNQASSSPNQPYQYMPDVAGALAFMFNLTGKDGNRITNLILNGQAVEDIFTGRIAYWDNPVIGNLNPQLAGDIPHERITFVFRLDACGENYLLSDYLLHLDPSGFTAFQNTYPGSGPSSHPSALWPQPDPNAPPTQQQLQGFPNWYNSNGSVQNDGQSGADSVADTVSAPNYPGSIGYVETAYAKAHNMPVASLVNASGHAVQPTSNNDAVALEKAILYSDLTENLANVYTNPLPDTYPISSYSYFVAPCSPSLAVHQGFTCDGPQRASPFAASKGDALGVFLQYVACQGQVTMPSLGYSPIPPNLVEDDFAAIGRMNGGHQPPPPTAANCKNPYISGQLALPGEPAVLNQINPGNTGVTTTTGAAAASATASGAGPGGSATAAGFSDTAKNVKGTGNGKLFEHADLLAGLTDATLRGFSAAGGIGLWCTLLVAVVVGPPLIAWQRGKRRRHAGGPDGGDGAPPGGGGEGVVAP
jgi:phosphate transport system substrate-binding protein